MKNFFSNLNKTIIFLLIITSLIIFTYQIRTISVVFPTSLTLLDNSNVLVANDGIHFFNEDFTQEDSSKRVELTIDKDDLEKITMSQFSSENDGYILILVQNILYIFDINKNLKKYFNITEDINANHYCIIPYKKDSNNNLNFIISYKDSLQIVLAIIQFNLSDENLDLIINKKIYTPHLKDGTDIQVLEGVSCIFMSYSTNILLNCFSSILYPPQIYSTSFNPENNFEEIEDLRFYKEINQPYIISAITNEDKKKAIIYFVTFSNNLFWTIFDYANEF